MVKTQPSPVTLHADPEHGGLRAAVIFLLVGSIPLLYFLLRGLWLWLSDGNAPTYMGLIVCPGAVILGMAAVWGMEQGLKKVWHSGRAVVLTDDGIVTQEQETAVSRLDWDGHVNTLLWRFVLKDYKRGGRERRVPEKWVCLAAQVQEGEGRVIVYTYVSPKKVKPLLVRDGRDLFHEIFPGEVYAATVESGYFSMPGRPDKIPAEVLAGKEGKYWLAEQRRWKEGFELMAQDFETFIDTVHSHLTHDH